MSLSIYQIDAFTNQIFKGNPAAVVPLREPAGEEWMQGCRAEMNLSETAFLHPIEAATRCAGSRRLWKWACAGTRHSQARTVLWEKPHCWRRGRAPDFHTQRLADRAQRRWGVD